MDDVKLPPVRLRTRSRRPVFKEINEYLEYCEHVRNMSYSTLMSKKQTYARVIRITGIKSLNDLDNEVINAWVETERLSGVSPRTINTRMANVLAMVRYYRDMGNLEVPLKVPLIQKMKEGPARRSFYTRAQIEEVLEYADEMSWLLIRISFDAGLRIHELANLSLSEMNGRMIKFVGKGFKPREAYISEEAYLHLLKWINDHNIQDKIWWNDRLRKQYSIDTLRAKMRHTFELAGYKDFYPHALRHSFATDAQKRGASIMELKELLGHSNVETTQRYIHGLDGQLQTLFDKYR
ncbi:MAG: tyrosine-type recombinase/integrase [Candidatus Saccharibacteria bacterium]|nr:tyrosine-type recombinase/integrase [Candidatus Saccharibacteria bacterium]